MPEIRFAKPAFDVGFATNDLEGYKSFWEETVGLAYDHLAKLGGGFHQHRWRCGDSIIKVNHTRKALSDQSAGGYRALTLAGQSAERLQTPDGVPVQIAPDAETDLTLHVVANDLAAFARFYGEHLGLAEETPGSFRLGRSRITATQGEAARVDGWRERGLRYMTVQIFDCDALTADLAAAGVEIGQPPKTVGQVRYSFIRDADGNWIELSERASLTGKPVRAA